MATLQLYNHTVIKQLRGETLPNHTYKVVLLSSSATINIAHTTYDQVTNTGAWEVYGNGWSTGGMALANVALNTYNTNGAEFVADNLAVAISGGALGPFKHQIIINSSDSNKPVGYVTLASTVTVADGYDLIVRFPTSNQLIVYSI